MVGGASVTVSAFLAEMAPAECRGCMVTQNELMIVTGQLLAIASTPAIVLWSGMLSVPESPRWLIVQGRIGEALEVLEFSTQAALIGNIANGVISVNATFFGIWMMGRHVPCRLSRGCC